MAKPGANLPPEVKRIINAMPSPKEVLAEVVKSLRLERRPRPDIASQLDTVLIEMMDEGKRILEIHQRHAVAQFVAKYNERQATDPIRAFEILNSGFTALGNQRKKRAGVHMEISARHLLTYCGIPHELGPVETGRVDNIVPSYALFKTSKEDCVILEFKRTVRERWKQAKHEVGKGGVRVWLVTLDDNLSKSLLDDMASGNITLYVPDDVHKKWGADFPAVRSLRTLVPTLARLVKRGADAA